MSDQPTVFIVDDETEVREALELLMQSIGLETRSFDSAQAFLDQFDPAQPGCLILDIRMPGMSGLELQERLLEHPLYPPVVIITGHGDVPMAVRAVQKGAVDFIEKPFHDQALLDSVHKALGQDAERRGEITARIEVQARLDSLTPREREVLDLVIKGVRNKVIAIDLGISQSTVEAHRAKIMEKMQASTLSELMRLMFIVNRC